MASNSFNKANIAILFSYEGTLYAGLKSDLNPHIPSNNTDIITLIQLSLSKIIQENISFQVASRTDKGVHADFQTANFLSLKLNKNTNFRLLVNSLNSLLPKDIRILNMTFMSDDFHPTIDAIKKEYHYSICYAKIQPPKTKLFSWHTKDLDFQKMTEAKKYFIGEHNFATFTNIRTTTCLYSSTIRTIENLIFDIDFETKNLLIKITGNNFLYKMVRIIVGTLVDIAINKISLESLHDIFNSKDRTKAGITAPAHGLTLHKIFYPKDIELKLFDYEI